MASGQMDPTNARLVYQRALRDPEVTSGMAINALAFWAFLDTKYPHCNFQGTMLRRSEGPTCSVFFREAERVVQKLQNPKDSELDHKVIESMLPTTRMVLVNKDFQLVPLFLNKGETRVGLLSLVTIFQNLCRDVQPMPHQEAQEDDVGNQEEEDGNFNFGEDEILSVVRANSPNTKELLLCAFISLGKSTEEAEIPEKADIPEMAFNAVALWVLLDTAYPNCEFQSTIFSRSEKATFPILITEANVAVNLLAQDTELTDDDINEGVLAATRIVLRLHANKTFKLQQLFVNREDTKAKFSLCVRICQNLFAELQQEVQEDEMGNQAQEVDVGNQEEEGIEDDVGNQEEGIGYVDDRTLEICSANQAPSMMSFLGFYSKFGKCIQSMEDDPLRPPHTASVVLKTTHDVIRVMGGKLINSKEVTIKNMKSLRISKKNRTKIEPRPHQEEGQCIGDEGERTLEINFTIKDPSMMQFLGFYREFGDCIQDIVMRQQTGSIVLKTQQDVTRVMGETDINCRKVTIKGMAMWIRRRKLVKKKISDFWTEW